MNHTKKYVVLAAGMTLVLLSAAAALSQSGDKRAAAAALSQSRDKRADKGASTGGFGGKSWGMRSDMTRDPEMVKLRQEDTRFKLQSEKLARQYRQAPKAQRDELRQKVLKLVEQHFDVRQQRRSLELKRMEAKMKRLREMLERRLEARKVLVEQRVSDILGLTEPRVRF